MPYSSGFVASTTCGADGYDELMNTTAGSCTETASITGATLRFTKAIVTLSTTMSFDGFGIDSFHWIYLPGGAAMFPSGCGDAIVQGLHVVSGVRVLPVRNAMARTPSPM